MSYCKKCFKYISNDCMLDNDTCVFCHYNINEWDSNGELVTKKQATRKTIAKIVVQGQLTPSANNLLRWHWAKRRRLKEQWYILLREGTTLGYWHETPKRKYKVTIIRHAPKRQILDQDNFIGGAKEVLLDNLKSVARKRLPGKIKFGGSCMVTVRQAGMIFEDSPEFLECHYKQVVSKEKKTEIIVED